MARHSKEDIRSVVEDYIDNRDAFITDDAAMVTIYREKFPTTKKKDSGIVSDFRKFLGEPYVQDLVALDEEEDIREEATLDRTRDELAAIAYSNILDIMEPDPDCGLVIKPNAWRRISRQKVAGVVEMKQVGTAGKLRWQIKMADKGPALNALARMDGGFDKNSLDVRTKQTEKTDGTALSEIINILKEDKDTRETFLKACRNDRELWAHFTAFIVQDAEGVQ